MDIVPEWPEATQYASLFPGYACYFLVGQRVMVVHAFVKKSQQTPAHELKLARKRIKEIRNA